MEMRLVTAPDDQTWERPRRPQHAQPPRWPWVAFWLVLASLAGGGWFAYAPEGDDRAPAPGLTATSPGGSVDPADMPENGFAILHATWGSVDDTLTPVPPAPKDPTEWQQREQAFYEMGRERWKGTELFVRRDAR